MRKTLLVVWALALALPLAGCAEKDDTTVAKIEDARIALDNGDYQKAIDILSPMLDKDGDGDFDSGDVALLEASDDEEAQLLASAYIGLAGVDMFQILGNAADAQEASLRDPAVRLAMTGLSKALNFVFRPAFAQASGTDCMTDDNYVALSSSLPSPLTQVNLSNLQFGLDILTHLTDILFLEINVESLQSAELLSAVGHAVKVAIEIILATDTNSNNIPNNFSGVSQTLADAVETSYSMALEALAQVQTLGTVDFGGTPFNSDILVDTITEIRDDMRAVTDDGATITSADLAGYLDAVTAACVDR